MVTRCYGPIGRSIAAAALMTTLFVQGHAWGDEVSAPAAQALFDEGRRLIEEGQYSEACDKFAESQKLDAAVGTLLNLAACHERVGKLASAYAEYSEAHALGLRQNDPERSVLAQQSAAALEPRLSRILIVLPHGVDVRSAWVALDGTPFAITALGTPIPVDPGKHRIEYGASGMQSSSLSIVVEGAGTVEAATLPPLKPVPPQPSPSAGALPGASGDQAGSSASPPPPTVEHPSSEAAATGTRTLAGASLGFSGLALAMGAYFGLQAIHAWDDRKSHCARSGCDQEGVDAGARAESAARLSNVLFAAGGLALGVGTYLLVEPHWFGEARSNPSEQPSPGPGGITLVARGSFQ